MADEQQQPTGASIKNERDRILDAVRAHTKTIELRKWCVEQTIKADCASVEGVQILAKFFYEFITQTENDNAKSS